MTSSLDEPQTGPRILGFGKDPENAAAAQARLREAGYRATNFALTDDEEGDRRLVAELDADGYDAVAIGGIINGQSPSWPPTEKTTLWFERVLNLIAEHSPGTRIVLVRGPDDARTALQRVLG
jgi:hypothetical protein